MKHIIVSDSSCDIHTFENLADNTAFSYAPLKIRIGEQEYVDNSDLDPGKMLEAMYAYQGATSSACPSPDEWATQFRLADEVFAFTITSKLSGSYNSAVTASDIVLETSPDKKICLIDTLSTGPEMVLLIQKLNSFLKEGLDFDSICTKIRAYQQKTRLLFNLESLDNLVKNGRISKVAAKVANVLNIRVVGRASDEGSLELLHKCHGTRRSYACILKEMIQNGYSNGRVIISHCQNELGALALKEKIMEAFENPDITIQSTGGLCSYYAERHGILVGYEVV